MDGLRPRGGTIFGAFGRNGEGGIDGGGGGTGRPRDARPIGCGVGPRPGIGGAPGIPAVISRASARRWPPPRTWVASSSPIIGGSSSKLALMATGCDGGGGMTEGAPREGGGGENEGGGLGAAPAFRCLAWWAICAMRSISTCPSAGAYGPSACASECTFLKRRSMSFAIAQPMMLSMSGGRSPRMLVSGVGSSRVIASIRRVTSPPNGGRPASMK
jgi:hypothetical protein